MRMGVRIPLYPALWKFNVNLFVLKGIAHTNFFLKLAIMKTSGIRVALCSSFFLLDFMKTCVFHQNLGSCNQEFINNGVAADIFCSKTIISKTAFFLDTSRQLSTASPPPKKKNWICGYSNRACHGRLERMQQYTSVWYPVYSAETRHIPLHLIQLWQSRFLKRRIKLFLGHFALLLFKTQALN